MTLFEATAIAALIGWLLVAILSLWLFSAHRDRERLDAIESATNVATVERMRQIQADLDASKASLSAQSSALDSQARALAQTSAARIASVGGLTEDQLRDELKKRGLSS